MNSKQLIYLDNGSTTQIDPRVAHAMSDPLFMQPTNASASHYLGRQAKQKITLARQKVKASFGSDNGMVIFTSSATESLNMIINGLNTIRPGHTIICGAEHQASLEPIKSLSTPVSIINSSKGHIDTNDLINNIRPDTSLIVSMSVNNETGIKTPIQELAYFAKTHNIHLVVDATASWGKEPFTLCDGITAVCLSPHKFHGPKGTGVCFIYNGIRLPSFIKGAMQEFGIRAGTENIQAIHGVGVAIELSTKELVETQKHINHLHDLFIETLKKLLPAMKINDGGNQAKSKHIVNICLPFLDAESTTILLDQKGILTSTGSACSSLSKKDSHVLISMNLDEHTIKHSMRISFSKFNTTEEVIQTAIEISKIQMSNYICL